MRRSCRTSRARRRADMPEGAPPQKPAAWMPAGAAPSGRTGERLGRNQTATGRRAHGDWEASREEPAKGASRGAGADSRGSGVPVCAGGKPKGDGAKAGLRGIRPACLALRLGKAPHRPGDQGTGGPHPGRRGGLRRSCPRTAGLKVRQRQPRTEPDGRRGERKPAGRSGARMPDGGCGGVWGMQRPPLGGRPAKALTARAAFIEIAARPPPTTATLVLVPGPSGSRMTGGCGPSEPPRHGAGGAALPGSESRRGYAPATEGFGDPKGKVPAGAAGLVRRPPAPRCAGWPPPKCGSRKYARSGLL